MSKPRIVFMGTPDFAVPALLACAERGEVVAVVTQPDKPKGRGQSLSAPPVKRVALDLGLPVFQPAKIRGTGFTDELRLWAADVCVVAAYGKILPKDVLETPKRGCLNVHASLLPRFRGAAPIQWAIACGDARTGITLMQMDEGLDTGPMVVQAEISIGPQDTSGSLHEKLAALGAEVLKKTLNPFLEGKLKPVPQPAEGVVYAPLIRKEEGAMDFRKPAKELERRARAFFPWPGSFVHFGATRLKVFGVRVQESRGAPGEVVSVGPLGLEVACGEGSVLLTELQPEGKRVMGAAEFLLGRSIEVGSFPFGRFEG